MRNRKPLEAYLSWLQGVLNLTEWTVRLSDVPADEGNAAEVRVIEDCRVADVFLAADWHTYSGPDMRRYLIHELLHLHHTEVEQVVAGLKPCLSTHEHQMTLGLHHHACEVMVDQLAYAIAALIETTGQDTRHLDRITSR